MVSVVNWVGLKGNLVTTRKYANDNVEIIILIIELLIFNGVFSVRWSLNEINSVQVVILMGNAINEN